MRANPLITSSAFIKIIASPDADRISRFKTHKPVSFISTVSVCLVLATVASADSLVVLLEGLGGQITSRGIVSFQEELAVIPNTRVALPLAQHSWRDAVKLIQQQNQKPKSL